MQANNVPVTKVFATNSDKATNSKRKVVRKVKHKKQRKWFVFDASESDTDVSTVASFHDSSDDDILSELEDANDLEKESIVKVVAGNYEGAMQKEFVHLMEMKLSYSTKKNFQKQEQEILATVITEKSQMIMTREKKKNC